MEPRIGTLSSFWSSQLKKPATLSFTDENALIILWAAGGRSVTVNVNIQGNVIGNREYTEQVGEYVGRKVLAALGNT